MFVVQSTDEQCAALQNPPRFINDIPVVSSEDREQFRHEVTNSFESDDVLMSPPRCGCGNLTTAGILHEVCDLCGTPVEYPSAQAIESTHWMHCPEQIDSFITPIAWHFLSHHMTCRGFNVLEWICKPGMRQPMTSTTKLTRILGRWQLLNLPRGLNSFVRNFDLIVAEVILPSVTVRAARLDLKRFLEEFREEIFVQVIPVPSRLLFIVEKTSVGAYFDKSLSYCIEAVMSAASMSRQDTTDKLEYYATSIMVQLCSFYKEILGRFIARKQGWLRQVCYGSRLAYTYRTIITSQHGPHDYGTIQIPYKHLLAMFTVEVTSALERKHGMTMRDAYDYCIAHATDMDPLICSILDEFIATTPGERGIGNLLIRYPTLRRGSTQWLYINGYTECDIKLSPLCLSSCNGDQQLH